MTRSSVPMTAQLGIVLHAAVSVGAMFAPRAIGRWLATMSHRSASGRSWAKESCTVAALRTASASPSASTFRGAGVAGDVEHGGRVGHVERRARAAEDDDATVGVPDEHDGPGRALGEERRHMGGVSCHAVQQVGRGQHGVALGLQRGGHGVPARSVGPGSVNEDDRRHRQVREHPTPRAALLGRHGRSPGGCGGRRRSRTAVEATPWSIDMRGMGPAGRTGPVLGHCTETHTNENRPPASKDGRASTLRSPPPRSTVTVCSGAPA